MALETAGGIKKAITYLGSEPFVVINADIFSNYDYQKLKSIIFKNTTLAYLVLVNNPDHNLKGDFGLSKDGVVTINANELLTFSGIAIYDPKLFLDLEKGKKIKLSPILKSAIDKNSIQGEFFEGKWSDVGTPERLKLINLGK